MGRNDPPKGAELSGEGMRSDRVFQRWLTFRIRSTGGTAKEEEAELG